MVEDPYFLRTLEFKGFRAYLQPKAFDFSKKRCLAIFAPNGNGKSSFVDALEFVFSDQGTLDRLGQRAVNNQAGPVALAHNRAEEAKITPSVGVSFIKGKDITNGIRLVTGTKRPIPPIASTVKGYFTVSPIIRGHSLRSFVEAQSAEDRYKELATWLQLGPLVDVQKNLRTLRTQVKAAADDTDAFRRVNTQVGKETAQTVTQWDDAGVLAYINSTELAPLDKELVFIAVGGSDAAYAVLGERVQAEERRIGLAGLRQVRQAAAALWLTTQDEETGEIAVTGAIPTFEAAAATLLEAIQIEADERNKASNAAFQTLWNAAAPLFAEDAAPLDQCPVCTTPLAQTFAQNAAGIRTHIANHLGELADYAKAKKALDGARSAATQAQNRIGTATPVLIGLLGEEGAGLSTALTAYQTAAKAWVNGECPDSADLVLALGAIIERLDKNIAEIEAKQGDHTYAKAKRKIDILFELQAERDLALRTQAELVKLSDALTAQTSTISTEIRKKVQALLDQIQTPTNDIYKLIQGNMAVPIRLELPAEDDTNQQRLSLVIDFADNRVGVQPGGYLSDSQIHSLALALRLAAIKQFNDMAPIVVLDDIVTSYDADHRRTIAGLIASQFATCQVLLTTHDERFFNYLKDQIADGSWQFTRIIGLDPANGPRFADHKVTDEMIAARWDGGQSAANELRQAEEEWLLGICRDFGVNLRIRTLEKAYSYERSELASALAAFLKGAKLDPLPVAGVANRFLDSLHKGLIENFGSHFQDALYGDGSIGDERTRWKEFTAFRAQFGCPACKRTRFKRPHDFKKPVCSHENCEAQFAFPAPAPAAAAQ